jgi:hypothetical protein
LLTLLKRLRINRSIVFDCSSSHDSRATQISGDVVGCFLLKWNLLILRHQLEAGLSALTSARLVIFENDVLVFLLLGLRIKVKVDVVIKASICILVVAALDRQFTLRVAMLLGLVLQIILHHVFTLG